MEDITKFSTEMYKSFRKSVKLYIITGIIFIFFLSAGIILNKYTHSLYETSEKFQEFNIKYFNIMGAITDIDRTITIIKRMLPGEYDTRTPEEFIFMGLDDIKSMFSDAEVTITNIEDRGNDVQLPVVIKSTLKDYSLFVNQVGYLQSLKFPFFSISAIKISKGDEKSSAYSTYEITGILKFPRATVSQATVPVTTPGVGRK